MYTWALLPILGLRWHFSEIMDLVQMKHMGHPISKVRNSSSAQLAL